MSTVPTKRRYRQTFHNKSGAVLFYDPDEHDGPPIAVWFDQSGRTERDKYKVTKTKSGHCQVLVGVWIHEIEALRAVITAAFAEINKVNIKDIVFVKSEPNATVKQSA